MRLRKAVSAIAVLQFAVSLSMHGQTAEPNLDLALPTENAALFHGGGAQFYQHIERDYKGVKTTPWQGGQYGFVRNPLETAAGIVYTRFHEGIDIRPTQRDARGEPQDEVHAIAAGKVVYTNVVPRFSNYGNYIVVEHRWGGSPYYSLYGHLGSISARTGERVARGEVVGVMGYTGEGLNQERAHLHLELNLMLSGDYEKWHQTFFPTDPNHHGLYNGINLTGIDIARLYLALQKRPSLTLPQFLAQEETFYRVRIPAAKHFHLLELYPWMAAGKADGEVMAWEVSFNRAGVPLKIAPLNLPVTEPQLSYVKKRGIDYSYLTRGQLGGRAENATLTESGKRLMRLLTFPD